MIQPDKLQHFTAMLVLTFFLSIAYDVFAAVALVTALSVGKELFDKKFRKQDFEKGDLAADAIGMTVGIAVFFLGSLFGYY